MSADIAAAQQFVFANARVLERHRLARLLHGAEATPVLDALRAYRNEDGGFGHALEPDVRAPDSEPASTLAALSILAEVGALADPMVEDAAAWVGTIADSDGGVPFVLPAAADHPHAPWMVPSDGGSHLTFAIAGALLDAGSSAPWLSSATEWCWAKLEGPDEVGAYGVKFALDFLDSVPDDGRAAAAIERLGSRLDADGTIRVPGGTEDERLTPLVLSERPGSRSRALFTEAQIERELDALERGQQDDGGWTFEWLAWSPGQTVEWRGVVTVHALATLASHGRIDVPRAKPLPPSPAAGSRR
jgi:hypothetical protein